MGARLVSREAVALFAFALEVAECLGVTVTSDLVASEAGQVEFTDGDGYVFALVRQADGGLTAVGVYPREKEIPVLLSPKVVVSAPGWDAPMEVAARITTRFLDDFTRACAEHDWRVEQYETWTAAGGELAQALAARLGPGAAARLSRNGTWTVTAAEVTVTLFEGLVSVATQPVSPTRWRELIDVLGEAAAAPAEAAGDAPVSP